MSSAARIAANRRNALKSTGPRTPQGKQAVRMNALWHGAYAQSPVLPGEDPAAFSLLLVDLRRQYQPVSPEEDALVGHLARAAWRLRHLPDPFASAWRKDSQGRDALAKLLRCQITLEHVLHRAIHQLGQLRLERALARHAGRLSSRVQPRAPGWSTPGTSLVSNDMRNKRIATMGGPCSCPMVSAPL
jgi:hypothetical protein